VEFGQLVHRAAERFSARDFEGADRILTEALESDPGNVTALVNL